VLLSTGEDVAVKVQRPAVLETVSIDLYIIRRLGVALRGVPQINTDVVALLDEWAERFFEELDYVKEGENATRFAASIKDDLPQVGGALFTTLLLCVKTHSIDAASMVHATNLTRESDNPSRAYGQGTN
jgi:hypothetical protein